jgi:hypothetical protein
VSRLASRAPHLTPSLAKVRIHGMAGHDLSSGGHLVGVVHHRRQPESKLVDAPIGHSVPFSRASARSEHSYRMARLAGREISWTLRFCGKAA